MVDIAECKTENGNSNLLCDELGDLEVEELKMKLTELGNDGGNTGTRSSRLQQGKIVRFKLGESPGGAPVSLPSVVIRTTKGELLSSTVDRGGGCVEGNGVNGEVTATGGSSGHGQNENSLQQQLVNAQFLSNSEVVSTTTINNTSTAAATSSTTKWGPPTTPSPRSQPAWPTATVKTLQNNNVTNTNNSNNNTTNILPFIRANNAKLTRDVPKNRHVCNSWFASCPHGEQNYRITPLHTNPAVINSTLTEVNSSLNMGNTPPSRHLEIINLKRELKKRDHMVNALQREVHKLRSVLQQTAKYKDEEVLCSLQQSHSMAGQVIINKKQGVSAESSASGQTPGSIQLVRHDKDFRSKQLIKAALLENDFLKNLEPGQMRDIIDCMYSRICVKGSFLIREGDTGSHLYVSALGEFEVIKDGSVLGRMGPGKAFGELAILYNCTRTASVRVVENGEVWVLDRRIFQNIMLRSGLQRLEDSISFLKSVPLLRNLNENILSKIANSMQLEFYPGGHYIIRQGASGDTFYILSLGTVKVTQRLPGSTEEEEVRELNRGDYFGEQALLKEDCRTASVIALQPGVECLTLDRESFMLLIGDLSELQEKDYGDKARLSRPPSVSSISESDTDFEPLELQDLDIIATLGVGGFGRVELVSSPTTEATYALKCLKKCHIVDTHQQTHVFSERNIMFSVRSPFICRLYQTFKDAKYVYLLMEACLGGEVWSLLRDRTCFDDTTACFITACVIEAIEYLHARNIVYRDLKPENLLLDSFGYVKLVDFGFAKKLGGNSGKTWTFCGTPEYVAPEIILNKGHDKSVDYWALGILMHELLIGVPPFSAADPMKTYNLILKGIDNVGFPRHVTRTAQNLIKRLCRESPSERLGCSYQGGVSDIKRHKWFQGFDWNGLQNKTISPPIIPMVRGPTDVSNFDKFPRDEEIPPDDLTNWDAEF